MPTSTQVKPRLLKPIACKRCGKIFQPEWSGRKFCSKECVHESIRIHPKFTVCEVCGNKIPVKHGRLRRFCSQQCFWKAPKERILIEKTCPNCQKAFRPRWDIQIFCSRKCGHENRTKERANCLWCGKSLAGKPTSVKYCSHKCHAQARARRSKIDEPIGKIKSAGQGYLKIKVGTIYPSADKRGWMPYHRYLMEQHLGRNLTRKEQVHHKNGDRSDNRIENLELMIVGRHTPGARAKDIIAEILAQPEILAFAKEMQVEIHTAITRVIMGKR